MKKRILYKLDFNKLKLALEKRGYEVYLRRESKLIARMFPYYFRFTKRKDYVDVHGHLNKLSITGSYIKSKSPGNKKIIRQEYSTIIELYIKQSDSSIST